MSKIKGLKDTYSEDDSVLLRRRPSSLVADEVRDRSELFCLDNVRLRLTLGDGDLSGGCGESRSLRLAGRDNGCKSVEERRVGGVDAEIDPERRLNDELEPLRVRDDRDDRFCFAAFKRCCCAFSSRRWYLQLQCQHGKRNWNIPRADSRCTGSVTLVLHNGGNHCEFGCESHVHHLCYQGHVDCIFCDRFVLDWQWRHSISIVNLQISSETRTQDVDTLHAKLTSPAIHSCSHNSAIVIRFFGFTWKIRVKRSFKLSDMMSGSSYDPSSISA